MIDAIITPLAESGECTTDQYRFKVIKGQVYYTPNWRDRKPIWYPYGEDATRAYAAAVWMPVIEWLFDCKAWAEDMSDLFDDDDDFDLFDDDDDDLDGLF